MRIANISECLPKTAHVNSSYTKYSLLYIDTLSENLISSTTEASIYSLPYLFFWGYSQSVPRKIYGAPNSIVSGYFRSHFPLKIVGLLSPQKIHK